MQLLQLVLQNLLEVCGLFFVKELTQDLASTLFDMKTSELGYEDIKTHTHEDIRAWVPPCCAAITTHSKACLCSSAPLLCRDC